MVRLAGVYAWRFLILIDLGNSGDYHTGQALFLRNTAILLEAWGHRVYLNFLNSRDTIQSGLPPIVARAQDSLKVIIEPQR
jgi:hypothetical protein